MNTVASSRNLRPNGLKTDRVLQALVGLVVCIWLVYQITHLQLGSVKTKISENEGVNSLGRKETAGQLNARGENNEGREMAVEREKIEVDLLGSKRGEIAFSDETNKNDEGSSSKLGSENLLETAFSDETNKNDEGSSSKGSENLLETAISDGGSNGKDVSQDKVVYQEWEENSGTQNTTVDGHSFHDENGIPKEMRDSKFAGSSSLNDQSESS